MRKAAGRRDPAQDLFDEANRHVRAGRIARARQLARQGAHAYPNLAAFWGLAGALALLERDWDAADAELTRARAMVPGDPHLAANLANAKSGRRDFAGAVPLLEEAFARLPGEPKLRAALADALARAGRPDAARALYAHACAGEAIDLQGRAGLALALIDSGRFDDAVRVLDAIPEAFHDDEILRLRATAAGAAWDVDAALEILRRPAAGKPPSTVRESAALFAAHYDEAETDEALFARHEAWGARFPDPPARRPSPLRDRLRVGFVSADLKNHSVARFFLALLAGRDPARLEIFCYADVPAPDAVSARIRAQVDRWHDVFARDDATVSAAIRADAPDVLIDLSGHTAANRLALFAGRAAANQATWLGYPDTTGLAAMDARLVDAVTDPPGIADAAATEKLVRIDGCFLCFATMTSPPGPDAPEGPPVFGSFNALEKMGPSTVALWARVLRAAPGSRLLLKTKLLESPAIRAKVEAAFAAQGIGADRLELRGYMDAAAHHLAAYAAMDVALDPLLYNGTTTTCEALSMGVPVVTLPGTRHAARVGASLLTASGFVEGIATSPEDYVARAVELAKDRARDRVAMRAKFEKSELCDAPGFARRFEAALRNAFT